MRSSERIILLFGEDFLLLREEEKLGEVEGEGEGEVGGAAGAEEAETMDKTYFEYIDLEYKL